MNQSPKSPKMHDTSDFKLTVKGPDGNLDVTPTESAPPIKQPISQDQPGQVVERTLPSNVRLTSLDDILPPAERAIAAVVDYNQAYKKQYPKANKVAYGPHAKLNLLPPLEAAQPAVEKLLRVTKATKAPEYARTKQVSEALKEHIVALQA